MKKFAFITIAGTIGVWLLFKKSASSAGNRVPPVLSLTALPSPRPPMEIPAPSSSPGAPSSLLSPSAEKRKRDESIDPNVPVDASYLIGVAHDLNIQVEDIKPGDKLPASSVYHWKNASPEQWKSLFSLMKHEVERYRTTSG